MQVMSGLEGLRALPPGTALSVGNFDGVHRGHREILAKARELDGEGEVRGQRSEVREEDAEGGGASGGVAVVTFEPHPLTVLRPEMAPPRLTTVKMKRELLQKAGVDYLVELAPQRQVLNLQAEEFWAILRDEVRPRHMIEGTSFNFGKDRGGTIEKLRGWAGVSEVQLHTAAAVEAVLLDLTIVAVSSSLIRWLIAHGRMRDAAICLGRAYALEGEVIHAHGRGKAIGVPTANLKIEGQIVPMEGVYAGRCEVDGKNFPAAISIGKLPTFGEGGLQVEAHLIGFEGDLYGRTLNVEVTDWIREQRKFAGVEELKRRLQVDIAEARERAGIDVRREVARV